MTLAELDGRPCLSLWQPWATLLVAGLKQVETRSWPTAHRGPLLIHAAKRWTPDLGMVAADQLFFRPALQSLGIRFDATDEACERAWGLPLGAIIGRVEVVDCLLTEDVREGLRATMIVEGGGRKHLDISMRERAFGDYSGGRFAWLTANPEAFADPVPYAGHQGIFRVRGKTSAARETPPPCSCGACNVCAMIDAAVNGPKPQPPKQQPEGGTEIPHPPPKPAPKPTGRKAPARTLFDGVPEA